MKNLTFSYILSLSFVFILFSMLGIDIVFPFALRIACKVPCSCAMMMFCAIFIPSDLSSTLSHFVFVTKASRT